MKFRCVLLLLALLAPRADACPPLVLVSMDAFRWDYCARHPEETPNLRELSRTGAHATELIPAFPSNTFPNHYSIVTGLYPSHHGIINNHMFDAATGEFFHSSQASIVGASHWWGGEPVWVTAIKQGGKAGSWFWIGSEAEIGGVRPTTWRRWDPALPFETRLSQLVAWLAANATGDTPVCATFYLEEVNSIGHKFGPFSPELAAAVKEADARIGRLVDALREARLEANLVIVSDHGMTPISAKRVIILDEYFNPETVQLDFDGPVAGLRPRPGTDVDALMRALAPLQHGKAYRAAELPARFRITASSRVPPVWIVPEEGWEIYTRAAFDRFSLTFNRGDHGYDPALRSMHGILIAHGPSFRPGVEVPPVENIHIYNLLCAALGLKPAPNDGDNRLVEAMLR